MSGNFLALAGIASFSVGLIAGVSLVVFVQGRLRGRP